MSNQSIFKPIGLAAALVLGAMLFTSAPSFAANENEKHHPAVGSWFGRAIEVCRDTDDPNTNCNGLGPAFGLFMTPTLTSDGVFLGNDSLSIAGAPFGPHTTAHGQWVATGPKTFIADYVFMLPVGLPGLVGGVRFRWDAKVVDANTIVGYVNLYFQPPLSLEWDPLGTDEFPVFPAAANGLVTSPIGIVKDPDECTTGGCPVVFKFTIKRVQP